MRGNEQKKGCITISIKEHNYTIYLLSHGELAAPMNDTTTNVTLALLTPIAYFYASLTNKDYVILVYTFNQLL